MKATKKELERALGMACRKLATTICCEDCIWPKYCEGKVNSPCAKNLNSHFLALAKQGKKEGK